MYLIFSLQKKIIQYTVIIVKINSIKTLLLFVKSISIFKSLLITYCTSYTNIIIQKLLIIGVYVWKLLLFHKNAAQRPRILFLWFNDLYEMKFLFCIFLQLFIALWNIFLQILIPQNYYNNIWKEYI